MTTTLSQSAIQDFLACRYLYRLKHGEGLESSGGSASAGPEQSAAVQQGDMFHRIAFQYLSGLDRQTVLQPVKDLLVAGWFEHWLETGLIDVPLNRCPEAWVTIPFEDSVLVARYDLLAWDRERLVVCDWKTGTKPSADMTTHIQTIVYRYVAVRSALAVTGIEFAPDQVELRYWYARGTGAHTVIAYSQAEYARDEALIADLKAAIEGCVTFDKTSELDTCRSCEFRATCRPTVKPSTDIPEYQQGNATDSFDWPGQ